MDHAERGHLQRRHRIEQHCSRIAARQLGVITRAQLLDGGLSARAIDYRVAAGKLLRCFPGVYRYPAAPATWQQRLLAACLWADAVASHRSAAALWRFADVGPGPIECTTTKAMRPTNGVIIHRTGDLKAGGRGRLAAIPVTSPARTLVDLAAVVGNEDLELALDDALHRRVTTLAKIDGTMSALETRGRKGLAELDRLLSELRDCPRVPTKFERILAKVLTARPLPRFSKEYPVVVDGRVIARIDFAYPEQRVGVEADSFKWHSSPEAVRRDRDRSNALTQLGWRMHRATWWDAKDRPSEVQTAVASLLGLGTLAI